MATLREKIAEKIQQANGDTEKAAIEVCKLLEDRIGLAGNGWFDDDQTMLDALGAD
ncbi:hypothetical protein [Massilia varians]|uniref:hypothetical protein n=1 Tax=Massilia varians TaxID=457921 RepID=UPI002555047E|nr:hypothetical protein [Massilia varians]MDK6080365.1 hypothetical protein [Massilia varians]